MLFQERNGAEFPLWNGQLRTTRRQVQSPALHSGLKDLYCYSCNIGRNWGLDLIPGPEAPYAAEQPEKIKNKKTKKQRKCWLLKDPRMGKMRVCCGSEVLESVPL